MLSSIHGLIAKRTLLTVIHDSKNVKMLPEMAVSSDPIDFLLDLTSGKVTLESVGSSYLELVQGKHAIADNATPLILC